MEEANKLMKNRDISVLAFKVLSIYSCLRAVEISQEFIPYFYDEVEEVGFWVSLQIIIPPILLIISGVTLWFVAPILSRNINDSIESEDTIFNNYDAIQTTAFSVVGIFVLVDVLPMFFRFFIALFMLSDKPENSSVSPIDIYPIFVYTIVKTIIGLWLLLNSKGLVKLVKLVRRN